MRPYRSHALDEPNMKSRISYLKQLESPNLVSIPRLQSIFKESTMLQAPPVSPTKTSPVTTIKPLRRLKRVCSGWPYKAANAASMAGLRFLGFNLETNGIWTAIGNLPKQQIERILACAEKMYEGSWS